MDNPRPSCEGRGNNSFVGVLLPSTFFTTFDVYGFMGVLYYYYDSFRPLNLSPLQLCGCPLESVPYAPSMLNKSQGQIWPHALFKLHDCKM